MAEVQTLLAKDVNSSKLAYAYLTIDNKRKLLMMATFIFMIKGLVLIVQTVVFLT